MRGSDTIQFLGLWESLHNSDFKTAGFDELKKEAGANSFTMSPTKQIKGVNAVGIVPSPNVIEELLHIQIQLLNLLRVISAEFKLYIIKDHKRLKSDENIRLSLNWNVNRETSKLNYRIYMDTIKDNLILSELTPAQMSYTYASEAGLLNMVLFGKAAKEWRRENPDEKADLHDFCNY